ncbi:unnamed protein product, partial [Mesorhabditis spiculigera]
MSTALKPTTAKRTAKVLTDFFNKAPGAAEKKLKVDVMEDAKPVKESATTTVEPSEDAENTPQTSGELASPFLADLLQDAEWREALKTEFEAPYWKKIEDFLLKEYQKGKEIFPPRHEIFTAFNTTPLCKIKVVLIGQDPYHNVGQAHGLCFSVKKGIKAPPSLVNMYKELVTDIPGFVPPSHGYLMGWAEQGVFMLNAGLTVEAHKANSHADIGWHKFTEKVIQTISRRVDKCVFLLLGNFAQKRAALVDAKKHVIIKEAHPSPLSVRHFKGCRPFSRTNEALVKFGLEPIDWSRLPLP